MVTLIKSITSEKGELFALANGRRVLLANCRPKVSIYEKSTPVPTIGNVGSMKSMRFVIALCNDIEFTRDDTSAERYELTADILRNDGIAERFYFHNVSLTEINEYGEWEFEVEVTHEQMKKLLAM